MVLLFKALAIPVFHFVYERYYGGTGEYDTGKFYNDAAALNSCAKKHPLQYIRVLGGNEKHDCLDQTLNWKQGRSKKFLYNDNHLIIGWHSLLHFLPGMNWPAHAFFDCLLSFLGLFLLYRAFRRFLPGQEVRFFWALCLLPSLWFYTGGLLKEGLVTFALGATCFFIQGFLAQGRTSHLPAIVLLLLLGLVLKPYLLLLAVFTVALFSVLERKPHLKNRSTIFIILFLLGMGAANFVSALVLRKNFAQLLLAQQKAFSGAAAGGIFLSGDTTFVQLPYDTSLVRRALGEADLYHIRKGVSYHYWEDSHNQDTLFNPSNSDTAALYELAFMTPASRSNFELPPLTLHPAQSIITALYHVLLVPFFFNAHGPAEMIVSLENLLLVVCFLLIAGGLIRRRRPVLFPVAQLCFVLAIFLIVALSSPNTGAIFRYRAPALPFLVAAGLYCLPLRGKQRSADRE
jgi:hypothetical protein